MALSDGDKDTCRELAREIVTEVLLVHIASCPHGKMLQASKWLVIGLCIGSGIVSGSLVVALARGLGL